MAAMNNVSIIRMKVGLGTTTLATILLELCMVRVFDVILNPAMGYMVVTAAMFALGLGGIYVSLLKPAARSRARVLPWLTAAYGGTALALLPVLNFLPFDMNFGGSAMVQLLSWVGMYAALITPFFIGGIVISIVFSTYSQESHGLYFYDLLGAGLGCLALIPLVPVFGPGGILFVIAALLCVATLCFSNVSLSAGKIAFVFPVVAFLIMTPVVHDGYFEFRGHGNKRGVDKWISEGKRDYVKWDAVSKLDVFNSSPGAKYFALDGGQQASWLVGFDGDFDQFYKQMTDKPDSYYFGLNSLVHYFKQGTKAEVLILGAAVGGETKAALLFGAQHVDAIELVAAMVDAAKGRYAEYSGNIFNHPRVDYQVGEGRTFLRSTSKKYDIIQMFSNHTSSSIAQGSGALGAAYLQTAEAYVEYFEHLKDDGILSINRHFYPRMLTTASLAWHQMGRTDFNRHILVLERYSKDSLPTVLIKMTPWSLEEVNRIHAYANREKVRGFDRVPIGNPSPKVIKGHPYKGHFLCKKNTLDHIPLAVGTHAQEHLDYPITLRLTAPEEVKGIEVSIAGREVTDNKEISFPLPRTISGMNGKMIFFEVVSDNSDFDKGFSIWLDVDGVTSMPSEFVGKVAMFRIAFHPLYPEVNILPVDFLQQPFPKELASQADYRLSPVTDNKPFFNMIRKTIAPLSINNSKYIDEGTARILNAQLLPFLSRDILSFVVVGVVSILFACIFVFVPLLGSSVGKAKWTSRGWYLVYFSCLGAGFIIIELMLIQMFTKLIGFPTHTFAVVLFSLLFAAGVGSAASKKWQLYLPGRWHIIFATILAVGGGFLLFYQPLFVKLLQYQLPVRIIAASLMMLPLGFFLGMPFPLGMYRLGQVEPQGIPWAWGMNGFFTVFGGFVSLICAFFFGFQAALVFALLIYVLAWFCFTRIETAAV